MTLLAAEANDSVQVWYSLSVHAPLWYVPVLLSAAEENCSDLVNEYG